MIEPEASTLSTVASFYDTLADDYDLMTDFDERLVRDEPVLRQLIGKHGIQTVLDAGAGTGLHTLILARLGVHVTAVDISGAMLRQLERHASNMALRVKTVESALEDLVPDEIGQVDAVLCLGNTLSHFLSDEDLQRVLQGFARVLHPGGVLLIQLPNYDRLLRTGQRIQSVRERKGNIYVRFYDFEGDRVRFNILTLRRQSGAIDHSLQTVDLRPLMRDELLSFLDESGFAEPSLSGGLSMQDFLPAESKDLVILAKRKESRER